MSVSRRRVVAALLLIAAGWALVVVGCVEDPTLILPVAGVVLMLVAVYAIDVTPKGPDKVERDEG